MSSSAIPESSRPSNRNQNWLTAEDQQLCRSWARVSAEPWIDADPDNSTLWDRIHADFERNKTTRIKRKASGLQSRWGVIQRSVCKFCIFLAQAEALQQSGATQEDKIVKAHTLYEDAQKSRFKFDYCWRILRDEPKWLEIVAKKLKNKTNTSVPAIVVDDQAIEIPLSRPPPQVRETAQPKRVLDEFDADTIERQEEPRKRRAQPEALMRRRIEIDAERNDFDIATADVTAATDPVSARILTLMKKKLLHRLENEGIEE